MTIRALLFASYRARAGAGELSIDVPPGATVRVAARAVEDATGLALSGAMCAVNELYSKPERVLEPGDTVAFLPPVSGG